MYYINYRNQGRPEHTSKLNPYPDRATAERAAALLKSQGATAVRIHRMPE